MTEAQYQKKLNDALYRARNPEKTRAASKRWLDANPGKRTAYTRKHRLGVDAEAYAALLALQAGVCAICLQPETALLRGKPKALAVDHDHATGQIRGLLCQRCNLAIGNLDDNADRARALAHYLETK